jgi:uncharacterized protein YozE (UPF0346 family)
MAIAFSDYLLGQRGRDDAVGDLARDAARDPKWPKQRGLSLSRLRNYLIVNNACQNAIDALLCAWNEYGEINRNDSHLAGELDEAARRIVAVPTRPLYRDVNGRDLTSPGTVD